jgi:hypothetical protein
VATEDQARAFANDDKLPDRPALLHALAAVETIDGGAFAVDPKIWRLLHGLTHAGYNQMSHRLNGGVLTGNYRPEFVDGMLRSVVPAGVWTTIIMGRLLGVPNVEREAIEVLSEHRWWAVGA